MYSSPSPEQLSDVPNSIPTEIGRRKEVYKSPEVDASIRKEKKRIQNRIAQKSFRKRKQDYVEALEMRVRELEAELEAHRQGSYCFDGLVASLVQDGSVACQS
ncbi:bZIP transcription factor [Aspergillus puulaauensis]|uniref:BZIP domain-containing protein n=1 Tax=Aspergillus puulaauensis TaxID=1220207 RepID=A0A7R8ANA1_9EURO|nr:uncharacterized protein APUU_41655A [Aspergillus puulaauensis]BCS25211.1 hypothetical protein APUU_41655A [Aspergillus puulaauensis]